MTTTLDRAPSDRAPAGRRIESLPRVEGLDKVTGKARYAYEFDVGEHCYAWPITATIGKGRVEAVDADTALAEPGVLAVIWHQNAPRLHVTDSRFVWVLQDDEVAFRGQVVGLVVADSPEAAREAASSVAVAYADVTTPDVVLRADDERAYVPGDDDQDQAEHQARDAERAFAAAPVQVDAVYRTPAEHNVPMEPHTTTAVWTDRKQLTVYDSNQGGQNVVRALATLFGLAPGDVRVINPHVGGAFGSKGTPRPNVVLAAMAALVVDRPVKLALSRQHVFDLVGFRTPTVQRVRLGADSDGRLQSIWHDALEATATIEEYAEQSTAITRMMYAAPHRTMVQRLVALDVPIPSWMRAPGEAPGSFALESAMDELAVEVGIDPVELRIRNEPEVDPGSGRPWASRNLVTCLREGAGRFGWSERPLVPGSRRDGRCAVGYGVASSTYPNFLSPNTARARLEEDGRFTVAINATDMGTGARTALTVLAAEALDVDAWRVTVEIGDTDLPRGSNAGGSSGTASWGLAVDKVCRELRRQLGDGAGAGAEITLDTRADVKALADVARHAFGAQFAEVRVDAATGEVRVARMTGVFACGRIVNPGPARSQFVGAMTMGIGMALFEQGVPDVDFGGFANHDFASYHVPSMADTPEFDVTWIDEVDDQVNPIGVKGIGEIGIVGTAAAVANAVYNATGVRVRDLPITVDKLLPHLP
jgi:xanthine dehydrogenase YagR molybdenum-binding subunit